MDAAGEDIACSFDSLPDHLLAHVITLTGRKHARHMVLVSSRWQRVCKPALWPLSTDADGSRAWKKAANKLVEDENGRLVPAYMMGAKRWKAALALQPPQ